MSIPTVSWRPLHYPTLTKKQKTSWRTNQRNRLNKRAIVANYKVGHNCSMCGDKDSNKLQFHHLRDKKFTVSNMTAYNRPAKVIMEEMNKCELLCGDCHREEHTKENTYTVLK